MRLEFSEEADADLDGIVDYTVERHGLVQARTYVGELRGRIYDLLTDRSRARDIKGLDSDLLQIKYRHHFVIFRINGDVLRVSRILHERMDAAHHLR